MIPNQWYAILESRSVPKSRPVGLVRMGERLVLWRDKAGQVVCLEDRCAHRGTALSIGRVVDGCVACPYHGFRYGPDGECKHMPLAGEGARIPKGLSVKRYVTREENGFIWLWWGEERSHYPEVPWIDDIPRDDKETVQHSEVWPFNYARLMENHLDVHHWAFVHSSIMVGVGEFFEKFECEVEGDLIKTWGTLRPFRKKEGSGGWEFRAYARMPNLAMIQVTPRFRSLVVQTPIDEETSWVLVRSYQTYARWPPMRQLIDWYCITFLFSIPIHRQDFPVFHTQLPRQTGVGVNKLVKADAGIAQYLALRERMIKEAARAASPGRNEIVPGLAGTADPSTRNAHVGIEPPAVRAAIWTASAFSFPLLMPSVLLTRFLAWRFGRP